MPTRILLVDDHEVSRLGLRTLFGDCSSFEVCGEAQNGMEALRKVPELLPDIVILDLSMPGWNGFETAARISTVAPSVRIGFFSAHEVPATAQCVGGDGLVSKSASLQDLVVEVNRVLQIEKSSQSMSKSLTATQSSGR